MRTQEPHDAGPAGRRPSALLAAVTAVPMLVQLALHGILPSQHARWSWAAAVLAALVSGALVVCLETARLETARLDTARLRAPGSQH